MEDGVTWLCTIPFEGAARDGVGQRCRERGTVTLDRIDEFATQTIAAEGFGASIEVFDLGSGQPIGMPLDIAYPPDYLQPGAVVDEVHDPTPINVMGPPPARAEGVSEVALMVGDTRRRKTRNDAPSDGTPNGSSRRISVWRARRAARL